MLEISDNPRAADRTILSNYKPPPPKPETPVFPIPVAPDSWGTPETWGSEIIDFPSPTKTTNADTTTDEYPEDEYLPKIENLKLENNDDSKQDNNDSAGDEDEKQKSKDIEKDNQSSTEDETALDSESFPAADSDLSESKTPQSVTKEDENESREAKDGETEIDAPRSRFYDALSVLEIEEARETARAQLGLAFEILGILRKRGLKADPESYQCLIDASGRCGDTERATKLLSWMHEDGIVADGVVYSCLVSAFSAENAWRKLTGKNEEELPG